MPGWDRGDLSVRVLAKMRLDLPFQGLDLVVEGDAGPRPWARTVAA